MLAGQCGDAVGSGRLRDTDVLEHAGRDDGCEDAGTEGKTRGIGDHKAPTTEALLNPPRQAIRGVVHADCENAHLVKLTDAVAIAAPNIE